MTNEDEMLVLCGLPLYWALNWDGKGLLKDHLEASYGFPLLEMTGGQIVEGKYKYPEDPDLPPLVKVAIHGCTYLQYDYGIVAIITGDTTFVARMD